MSYRVAILGGGPAGLSAAQRLAELGVDNIVLIEREEALGGVPRHCGHPAFGLREFHRLLGGPAYARRLAAAAAGIEIRNRTTVTAIEPEGRVRTLDPDHGEGSLEAEAILLAFGVRETPRSARLIGGDRPWGVITTGALQQFVYLQKIRPFRRAVIVGSELVAFSALLTLRHGGIATAAMIEEGPRITARRPADVLARLALGVPVLTSSRLIAIHGLGKVEAVEIERAGEAQAYRLRRNRLHRPFPPRDRHSRPRAISRSIPPPAGPPSINIGAAAIRRSSSPAICCIPWRPPASPGPRAAPPPKRSRRIWRGACRRQRRPLPSRSKPPLRYVYPQRLVAPIAGLSPLLLKARAERRGARAAAADGRWTRGLEPADELAARAAHFACRSIACRARA